MKSLRSLLTRSRPGKLGLIEVIAMGVGGMVSGGIYAVLGVAMQQAGNAVPLSYLIAGIITLLTAYSYLKLTLHFGEHGGVFSFVEHIVDTPTIAAYVGWVLVIGYVGVMAMYAFAFGAYTLTAARAIAGIELPQLLRPIISTLIVAAFVGLNLRGVNETGLFEDIAVYIKIIILLSLATLGVMATLHLTPEQLLAHQEVALAEAVSNIPVLGGTGFVLVILSAMKSTSSGINATLFGTSRLVHKIATEGALPRVFSFRNREGIPVYSLLIIGSLTAALAALGTLKQITEFGSVAFLISFAVTNYTNIVLADETDSNHFIPILGLIGTGVALPVVLYHLYQTDVEILLWIVGIFAVVFLIEFLYVERSSFTPDVDDGERG